MVKYRRVFFRRYDATPEEVIAVQSVGATVDMNWFADLDLVPENEAVIGALESLAREWGERGRHVLEVGRPRWRYTPEDFDKAEFVLLLGMLVKEVDSHRVDGVLQIDEWSTPHPDELWVSTDESHELLLVNDLLRYAIRDRFKGPKFIPTVPVRSDYSPSGMKYAVSDWRPAFGGAWWELGSSLTLPPASRQMVMRSDEGGRIIRGGEERYVRRRNDEVDNQPFVYERATLDAFGAFDLAATYEHHGWQEPYFVFSQRFWRALRHEVDSHSGRGWDWAEWEPVQIVE